MTDGSALDRLVFHEVDQARWPDFEHLVMSCSSTCRTADRAFAPFVI